ncbi:hypothetical protein LIPSTDRAFT_107872 [Lipomyces starkeyi NRRL Y-11557]|uniref:Uncharacterized protein n=1 Tax=Lipomyces starkeyi NRRL Y-11557 TaxID=675824 RepID=A0A1E3PW58_LIPST|nr:hypothetical protein LIPSTDRAFT_107872 [Lipomyces starkeyi NRRL Y-11557]
MTFRACTPTIYFGRMQLSLQQQGTRNVTNEIQYVPWGGLRLNFHGVSGTFVDKQDGKLFSCRVEKTEK